MSSSIIIIRLSSYKQILCKSERYKSITPLYWWSVWLTYVWDSRWNATSRYRLRESHDKRRYRHSQRSKIQIEDPKALKHKPKTYIIFLEKIWHQVYIFLTSNEFSMNFQRLIPILKMIKWDLILGWHVAVTNWLCWCHTDVSSHGSRRLAEKWDQMTSRWR